MTSASIARPAVRRRRGRRTRTPVFRARWPSLRRALIAFLAAPLAIRLLVATAALVLVWAAVNWMYQVVRKPTELFFPVSSGLAKPPHETWRRYRPLFVEHSTPVITPELLAALAQVEGAGNPVARTYWRWTATWNPMEVYRPASSAVGMYQITTATFADAKRYCIHDHVVVEAGRWSDLRSCWFNDAYTRVVPSHAIEMTAALLDHRVATILAARRIDTATLGQKQDLAAVVHLCGAGAGDAYARRGFRLLASQRCGDHDVSRYLASINALKRRFAGLANRAS